MTILDIEEDFDKLKSLATTSMNKYYHYASLSGQRLVD